jgi:hypothetical protein
MVISGSTKLPPLNPAIGVCRASGSINIAMPRGGRPLVIAKAMPARSSSFTAARARGVSNLSAVTRVPSTSPGQARFSKRHDHALPCAISCRRRLAPHVRTVVAEDESLDRIGEAILLIAVGHEIRGPPHLRTGIAHRDGKTTPLEHGDIVAAIADDGDFRQRYSQQLRELRQCDALVANGCVMSR